jgi:hypothetical protein
MVADLSLSATAWFGPGVMRAIQGENGAAALTDQTYFVAAAHLKRRC